MHGAWKRATFLRYDYRRNMKAKEYVDGRVRTVVSLCSLHSLYVPLIMAQKRTRCVGGCVVWADRQKVCYDLNAMRRIYGR
jgi:hypothetical protein